MIDKSKELTATVKLVNDKLKFSGTVEGNDSVSIDYISPLGDDSGYTSLELLLMSLCSCLGSASLTFLRRMKLTIIDCEIGATGIRNEDHPTGFNQIMVDFTITSPDVTASDMEKVIKLAEDKYCPVWAMLKGNVEVDVRYKVLKETTVA